MLGSVWMHPRFYVLCDYGDQVVCALHSFSHFYLLRGLPSSYTCYALVWFDNLCMEFLWHILIWTFPLFHYFSWFISYSVLMHSWFLVLFKIRMTFMIMLFVLYSYSFVAYAYLPLCYVIYIYIYLFTGLFKLRRMFSFLMWQVISGATGLGMRECRT